jgi:rod shape-determining protein MreC
MYRRTGRGRLMLFAFIALSIAVVTLDFRQNRGGPLKRAKDLAVTIVAPIQRGFTTATRPVGDFFSSIADLANLRVENERLRDRLQQAEADADGLPVIEDENEEFRDLLDLEESWRTMDKVFATVISDGPSNWKWSIEISKGRADGIRNDMAVVNPEGLVGKIIRVGRNYSTVLLLVDPAGAASARIPDQGDAGLIEGNGGGERLSLTSIDTTTPVAVGDEVVTLGRDRGIFPPGIEIGEIVKIAGSEAALERQIDVQPSVDFKSLGYVMVLLETGDRIRKGDGRGREGGG